MTSALRSKELNSSQKANVFSNCEPLGKVSREESLFPLVESPVYIRLRFVLKYCVQIDRKING